MMFFFAWILATAFLIYLSFRPSSIFVIIILTVLISVFQLIILFLGYIGFMFNDEIGFAIAYFLMLELLVCSLYKCRNISYKELILGVISLIILGIWQYYNGSVVGEFLYLISDAGGMHKKVPYLVYRWSTYIIMDVLCPWVIISNIIISPFWRRLPATGNYWIKLIYSSEGSEL